MSDATTRDPWDDSFKKDEQSERDRTVLPNADRLQGHSSISRNAHVRYFGDYELCGEIGEGGMGVVFLAKQKSLNRTVALKMIRSRVLGSTDERAIRLFRHEAEMAARLDHANIATVYEVGEHDGQHYYTMKYVNGMDLGRIIELSFESKRTAREGDKTCASNSSGMSLVQRADASVGQPTADFSGCGEVSNNEPIIDLSAVKHKEIAALMSTVARAIHFAHRKDVVHRDIKPQNILIDRNGQPHVADFGLAKLLGDDQSTKTGSIVGTVHFMPPEQAAPDDGLVGAHSDIYSLGATLYAMLTGRPPLDGSVTDVLAQIKVKEPKRLRELNPTVPRDLESVCLKCLEKSPQRRYATANELAEDLDRFTRGEPVLARSVSNAARSWKWCTRNPIPASLTVAVLLLLLVFAVGGPSTALYQRQLALEATKQRLNANQARDDARESLRQSQQYLAKVFLQRGVGRLQHGSASSGFWDLWQAYSISADDPVTRASAMNLMAGWSATPQSAFQNRWNRQLATFSSNHTNFLTSNPSGDILVWNDISGVSQGVSLDIQHHLSAAAFSRDGRILVTGEENGTVSLWDTATGARIGDAMKHRGAIRAAVFNESASEVVTVSEDRTAQVWDAATGQPKLTRPLTHEDEVWCVAYSPDGATIITGGKDYTAQLWDAVAGTPRGSTMEHMGRVVCVAFASNGTLVSTASDDGTVRLWDGRTGEKHWTHYRPSPVRCLKFCNQDKYLVAGFQDGTILVWYGKDADPPRQRPRSRRSETLNSSSYFDANQPFMALPSQQSAVLDVAFSPEGELLASGCEDGQVHLWSIETGQQVGRFPSHHYPVRRIAFTDDRMHLLTSTDDGTICKWKLAPTGQAQQISRLPPLAVSSGYLHLAKYESWPVEHGSRVTCVDVSPHGKLLATASVSADVNGEGKMRAPATNGLVQLWRLMDNGFVEPYFGLKTPGEVFSLAFDSQGRYLLLGGSDGDVRLVDLTTDEPVVRLLKHNEEKDVWPVGFHPSGDYMYTGDEDGKVRFWQLKSGDLIEPVFEHDGSPVWTVAFSADGKLMLTGCEDGLVRLWDLKTRSCQTRFAAHVGGVWNVAFHPNGGMIATGGGDQTAKLWTLEGKPIGEPLKHAAGVWSVRFDPTGHSLLTGSWDSTVQLWDVTTGLAKGPRLVHGGGVTDARFAMNGDWVVTASWDHTARIWNVRSSAIDDPRRLRLWIEVQTAMRLSEEGTVVPLDYYQWRERQMKLNALGGSPFANSSRKDSHRGIGESSRARTSYVPPVAVKK